MTSFRFFLIGLLALPAFLLFQNFTSITYSPTATRLFSAGDADVYAPLGQTDIILAETSSNSVAALRAKRINFTRVNLLTGSKIDLGYYDPGEENPQSDYCYVWAPTITSNTYSDQLVLMFSAMAVPEGTVCESLKVDGIENSKKFLIYAVHVNRDFVHNQWFVEGRMNKFGRSDSDLNPMVPAPIQSEGWGSGWAKIDPFVFENQLLYVYHETNQWNSTLHTNSIEAVNFDELKVPGLNGWSKKLETRTTALPSQKLALSPIGQGIVEGPAISRFGGLPVLFFQGRQWSNNYTVFYQQSSSETQLDFQESPAIEWLKPILKWRCKQIPIPDVTSDCVLRNFGISQVFWSQGKFYVAYHVLDRSIYKIPGEYPRSTWIAPITVTKDASGTIRLSNPTSIDIDLIRESQTKYALNLLLKNGTTIENCYLDANIQNHFSFDGVCQNETFYPLDLIDRISLVKITVNSSKKYFGRGLSQGLSREVSSKMFKITF